MTMSAHEGNIFHNVQATRGYSQDGDIMKPPVYPHSWFVTTPDIHLLHPLDEQWGGGGSEMVIN